MAPVLFILLDPCIHEPVCPGHCHHRGWELPCSIRFQPTVIGWNRKWTQKSPNPAHCHCTVVELTVFCRSGEQWWHRCLTYPSWLHFGHSKKGMCGQHLCCQVLSRFPLDMPFFLLLDNWSRIHTWYFIFDCYIFFISAWQSPVFVPMHSAWLVYDISCQNIFLS